MRIVFAQHGRQLFPSGNQKGMFFGPMDLAHLAQNRSDQFFDCNVQTGFQQNVEEIKRVAELSCFLWLTGIDEAVDTGRFGRQILEDLALLDVKGIELI